MPSLFQLVPPRASLALAHLQSPGPTWLLAVPSSPPGPAEHVRKDKVASSRPAPPPRKSHAIYLPPFSFLSFPLASSLPQIPPGFFSSPGLPSSSPTSTLSTCHLNPRSAPLPPFAPEHPETSEERQELRLLPLLREVPEIAPEARRRIVAAAVAASTEADLPTASSTITCPLPEPTPPASPW